MAKAPKEHAGIPRTLKAAKELGHKKSDVGFNDLSDELKTNFIHFSTQGARAGSVCGVAPSPDPNFWLVCYKNESGICNWVKVPRTRVQVHD
jgi:hypothetical protein